jgi:hypothetical protein
VTDKLQREPVEDLRLDFEDGYGTRPDREEDGHAVSAAQEVAAGLQAATLPPFIGIRIKPLTQEMHARSLRTSSRLRVSPIRSARSRRRSATRSATSPHPTISMRVIAPRGRRAVLRGNDPC